MLLCRKFPTKEPVRHFQSTCLAFRPALCSPSSYGIQRCFRNRLEGVRKGLILSNLGLFNETNNMAGVVCFGEQDEARRIRRRWCPFSYNAELQNARKALNSKVGAFVTANPTLGYRELARMFGASSATLCSIATQHSQKRKPGRRVCRAYTKPVGDVLQND